MEARGFSIQVCTRNQTRLQKAGEEGAGPWALGAGLETLREYLVSVKGRVNHGGAGAVALLNELFLQFLHLVVVQVLLNEVAFPLHSGFHVRRNVRDHPGHEELHGEHHMLRETDETAAAYSEHLYTGVCCCSHLQ